MKALSGLAPDEQPNKVTSVHHTLDPLERTGAQINILRSVVDTAAHWACTSRSPVEGEDVDPMVTKAAASTAVMALHQIDTILDDMSRWSNTGGENEKDAKELLKAETDRVKAAAERARQLSRPFYLLRARVFRTQSGKFVAINESESIYGHGDTAAEAAAAFDEAFYSQRFLPSTPPEQPSSEAAPVPKRKRNPRKDT